MIFLIIVVAHFLFEFNLVWKKKFLVVFVLPNLETIVKKRTQKTISKFSKNKS